MLWWKTSVISPDGALEVTSERSVASVGLLALLSGQIQITGIELKSPRFILGATTGEAGAETAPMPKESGDIFKTIAGYMENISIDHVTVVDGEVAARADDAATPMASDIDMRLSIPGIRAPSSLAIAATVDGNRMELTGEIGSLNDLLSRQTARFSLTAKSSLPVHPALADLTASGTIQLAADGSYRIAGGEIDSIGQKMQLDVNYVPGDQPSVAARIKAGSLAYADFVSAPSDAVKSGDAETNALDLSVLKTLNADIELYAQAISVGDATARDVVIAAVLQDGKLISTLDSTDIAGGSLVASMALNANVVPPVSSGSLNLTTIDIQQILALTGQKAPVSGALSSELQYAFKGLDIASIQNSLNLRGTASIAQGRIDLPQLAALSGQNASMVDTIEASVRIEDIVKPMTVSGSARWNGEQIAVSSSFTATDLLWHRPGTMAINVQSQPINASFAGTITPAGQVSGKADIATPSLTRALGWLGQSVGTPLGRFSFSGGLSADGTKFGVSDSKIQLDDITANGSLSIAIAEKPSITANLSVGTLDFSTLISSGGENQTSVASSGPTPIDLSMLRLFNADIRLAANQLGYGKVKMGPASATLTVTNGIARLNIPQAGFYEGTISAEITANGAGTVPAIDLVAAMEGVEALPLLSDASGFDRVEGRLKASVQVAGAGADSQAFARSLNGPINVVISDGALRGIDVAGLVRNVRSLIGSGYAQDANARTEFSELSVPITITNGVARAENIRVLGPFVRMSGAGNVDLASQTINMRLDPRVVGSLDGQGGDFDVSGLGMPIMITGPLSGPRIYPDLSHILADPNQALQALTQLGGGVGELAGNAAGLIDGLGTTLGGEAGTLGNGALNDTISQILSTQGQTGDQGATGIDQDLLGTVLGNALGEQFPGLTQGIGQAQQVPTTTTTPPAGQGTNLPLPRPDPRGPAPVPSTAPPAPPRTPQALPPTQQTPTQQLIDLIAPQQVPGQAGNDNDPLGGLFNQLGF